MRIRTGLDRYLVATSVAGFSVLGVLLADGLDLAAITRTPLTFALLAAFVVATESRPIQVPYQDQVRGLTITAPFTLALLLGWGTAAAAGVIALASAISDLTRRKAASRVVFNVAQYVLSVGAAGLAHTLLNPAGRPVTTIHGLLAAVAAGLVYACVNHVLVAIAVGLADGHGIRRTMTQDLGFAAWSALLLIGIAPVAGVITTHSPLLAPTLLIPVAAVYLACQAAVTAHLRQATSALITRQQQRIVDAQRAAVRELEEADRVKARLLAGVSHELRSPLTTILGALRVLEARYDQLDADQTRELVEMGARQARKLQGLIEQLLLAADLERVRPDAERTEVDAAELAGQTVTASQAQHPGRVEAAELSRPLPVLANAGSIGQVLANLIDNACTFSPPGSPVRVSATRSGSLAVIAVEDAGSGIPTAERNRVFESFTQLTASDDAYTGGFGLGLYIARQLAREQGGDLVACDAKHLGGARFELRLPLLEHDREPNGQTSNRQAS